MCKRTKLMLIASCLCCETKVLAQEQQNATWKPELGLDFTTEMQLSNDGKFNSVHLLNLYASLPVSRTVSVDISTLSTCMTSKDGIGKDLQGFSNIEAGNIPFTLSMCGVNWEINDSHTLFMGIRSMNEDYFASPVTSFFTNSSGGIHPTIGCNFPITNYPYASVGAHYRYEKELATAGNQSSIALQASLYNGSGYNRFTGRENMFRVCPKSDGVFGLAEVSYQRKGSSYFLGACGHNGESDDSGKQRFGSAVWTYGEQNVGKNFSLIAAYSHAFGSSLSCTDFAGIGGMYSWNKCQLGLFTDYAHFSEDGESATEITCKVQLTPIIHIQPTVHLISSPSELPGEKNHFQTIGTLRLGISI